MNKPICDFIREYAQREAARFHMPGHKGTPLLGIEAFDITEIDGADELFTPSGVIAESEKNASDIFGSKTFYSAGGSTLCIQTMVHLCAVYAVSKGKKPLILAGCNAHRSFVNAAAMLGIEFRRLYPKTDCPYLSCPICAEDIEKELSKDDEPTAVYLTSPDYLGNILDIQKISEVCKKHGVPLLVDNAHGAYLKFLPKSLHPIDLGADMCCDSAHKTLPVITGGAYLHISDAAPVIFSERAKSSMSLFGSSSPSYLILQSLDAMNGEAEKFKKELADFLPKALKLKNDIEKLGFDTVGDEPLKITVCPKSFGYTGTETAKILMSRDIYPEFYDPDAVVLMLSPKNSEHDLKRLLNAIRDIKRREAITEKNPPLPVMTAVMPAKDAIFAQSETVPTDKAAGRICAAAAISCPPAIPIAVYGEKISKEAVDIMKYYGVENCEVIKRIKE